jgi:3-hydroxyanthranilate 3,4-dioxygenase
MFAINFPKWVEENAHLLQPPVNNKCVFSGSDFFVMAVGGPNNRTDYHVNETEEWFYQIRGSMNLKIVDESTVPPTFRDILIEEGGMFLLPGKVPHSPQRFADTLGIVIERTRTGHNALPDKLRWYCGACKNIMYEESFLCADVVEQLKEIINRFHSGDKICPSCGTAN